MSPGGDGSSPDESSVSSGGPGASSGAASPTLIAAGCRHLLVDAQGMSASASHSSTAARSLVAGPSSNFPAAVKRDPCNGQSQVNSASCQCTRPPKCGQVADIDCVCPPTVEVATGC